MNRRCETCGHWQSEHRQDGKAAYCLGYTYTERPTKPITMSNETVQLSRIANTLLVDFEAITDCRVRQGQRARMMEIISEAMHAALRVTSMRCPRCDSADITLVCDECVKEAKTLPVEALPKYPGRHPVLYRKGR